MIDLPSFMRELRGERTTAMVVHGPPLSGKTRYARRLGQQPGYAYLDVLGELNKRPESAARIDEFDASSLRDLILETVNSPDSRAVNVLLIDDLDFLFPVWGGELLPFMEMVRSLANPERAVSFALFIQDRPEWENWSLQTSGRKNRVISFEQVKPL